MTARQDGTSLSLFPKGAWGKKRGRGTLKEIPAAEFKVRGCISQRETTKPGIELGNPCQPPYYGHDVGFDKMGKEQEPLVQPEVQAAIYLAQEDRSLSAFTGPPHTPHQRNKKEGFALPASEAYAYVSACSP